MVTDSEVMQLPELLFIMTTPISEILILKSTLYPVFEKVFFLGCVA